MSTTPDETEAPFVARVTLSDEEGWNVEFGEQMKSSYTDETKLYMLSELLNRLSLRLSRASVADDDWDEDA